MDSELVGGGWSALDRWKVWSGLQFKLSKEAESIFMRATSCVVGKGDMFASKRRWVDDRSTEQIAPALLEFVRVRGAKGGSVQETQLNAKWISDIRRTLLLQAIWVHWSMAAGRLYAPSIDGWRDCFTWRLTSNGQYSAASSYLAFFQGSIEVGH